MNFNGNSLDFLLESKIQNIDPLTTVAGLTDFVGDIESDAFITTGGSSSQFVKGDGTLDSSTLVANPSFVNFEIIGADLITNSIINDDQAFSINLTTAVIHNGSGNVLLVDSSIESISFNKTGGTNIEYLMADGSTLTQSATSGNSNFYLYDNTNSTTDITPISGEVIINSLVNSTATIVYISHITRDNIDVEVFWKFINTLTELYLQDQTLSTNYIQYNITAAPTITVGDKIAIPVTVVNSAGTGATSFGVNHNILVSFFTNNLEVDTRLSNVETKTQSQTATSLQTTFRGQTVIKEKVGILTPHTLIINCDDTSIGPRIISTDGGPTLKPLELSCTNFNLNCEGFNNIRCAAGQNIALIGNVNNIGYTITSNKFITNGGLVSQFVKGNGTLDSTAYLPLSGGTLTGNVSNIGYTTSSNQFITNGGLSTQFVKGNGSLDSASYLPLSGGALIGQVTSNQTPILTTQLTTKKYADKTSLQSINSSYLLNFEWSARPSAAEGSTWNAVCWSTNLAVAVASNGSIMTSPNGVNWTLQANPGGMWFDVCWSQELLLFCAVANSGTNKIVTSPDGITWTLQTTLSAGMSNIVWSKEASKFVSVGGSVCITSVDGINWITQTIESASWSALCYSRELGIFVALAPGRVGISSDGITWTGSSGINANTWATVVWAEELGIFVAVSTNGTLRTAYSTNGTTWTYSPSSDDTNAWFTVVWARECALFVAVGYNTTNRVMTSPDGIKWTGRVSGNEGNVWRGLCWAKDINSFISVSNSGTNRVMTNNLQNDRTFLINTNTPFIFKGFTFKVISPQGIVFVKNNNSLIINGNQTNNYSGFGAGIYLYTFPANTVPSATVYTTTSFASASNPGQTNRLCFIDETNSVGYIIESITRTSGNVLITCSNF